MGRSSPAGRRHGVLQDRRIPPKLRSSSSRGRPRGEPRSSRSRSAVGHVDPDLPSDTSRKTSHLTAGTPQQATSNWSSRSYLTAIASSADRSSDDANDSLALESLKTWSLPWASSCSLSMADQNVLLHNIVEAGFGTITDIEFFNGAHVIETGIRTHLRLGDAPCHLDGLSAHGIQNHKTFLPARHRPSTHSGMQPE
eukprot:7942265-Heterocapsa_arctica.AAC.1